MEHHLRWTSWGFFKALLRNLWKITFSRGLNAQMQPLRVIQHLITLTSRENFCKGEFFLEAAYTVLQILKEKKKKHE